MIMTSIALTRFAVDEVAIIGRHTQGVRLMNVAQEEKITSVGKVLKDNGNSNGVDSKALDTGSFEGS